MASEKDFELLDDYIGNRLKGTDKQSFEDKLHADTDLQNELKLQQGIVESLRKARAAELKQFLNNIPASSIPPDSSSTLKWVGAASAVILAVGAYFFLNTEEPPTPRSATEIVTPKVDTPAATSAVPDETAAPASEETEISPGPVTPPKGRQTSPNDKNDKANVQAHEEATTPAIDVFDPSAENQGAEVTGDAGTQNIRSAKSEIPTEVNSTSKVYTFHYQFKNDKLILYGAFDKNPYQILDFVAEDKTRTVFLYYNSAYYLLNHDGEKVRPLSPVNDPKLLQKLKEYTK
jgi:hypothetical protein